MVPCLLHHQKTGLGRAICRLDAALWRHPAASWLYRPPGPDLFVLGTRWIYPPADRNRLCDREFVIRPFGNLPASRRLV